MGRFAPSPTGPLHLGSLYTALASYLDARRHNGLWLLRIDDLDTPRNADGASDAILRCLERFGLHWDGNVYFQIQHLEHYQQILATLQHQQWLYACRCSRKTLANTPIYPGYCREAGFVDDESSALRLKTQDRQIEFDDALQGFISQNLIREHGDFIVRRKDRIIAYQFAVVIDDYNQRINHVVRGADLLDSTAKQLYLQQLLGYPMPRYTHLPLIVDQQGNKLSKQTLAAPADDSHPESTMFLLLRLLRQNPPAELANAPAELQLQWAIAHWKPLALKKIRAIQPPIH
ncbi:tRNA glutamyl-Q(34) synthetase GluQRS [Methylomonas sp. LL1]|uniref:tRNA glutamyl-Q(34) synthetase GluQRS n=1 Tax=Methylomonas sp. LL1 TaxID=2785785 RepID=UPI002E7BE9CE|nr:tRNA glutamyl-Q(34) synthetase GluQRS [Methylomonas sp. LL1]